MLNRYTTGPCAAGLSLATYLVYPPRILLSSVIFERFCQAFRAGDAVAFRGSRAAGNLPGGIRV